MNVRNGRRGAVPLDVVVVGAGQAGLAVSYYLRAFGIEHLVLERGRIAESWRSARWDSFTLVTPNWMTRLPGHTLAAGAGAGFLPRDAVVGLLRRFADGLPVAEGVEVLSVRRDGHGYLVTTLDQEFAARAVVMAGGGQRVPVIPAVAARLPAGLHQCDAARYRNPAALPPGAVLVVGSGQSGAQIAGELATAGREVLLATSRVGRVPRRYRGRDVHEWSVELGLYDQATQAVTDPGEFREPHPMLSGAHGGHTLALQQLARDGVRLLGRLADAEDTKLTFSPDLAENMQYADRRAAGFRRAVDSYVAGADGSRLTFSPDLPENMRYADQRSAGFRAAMDAHIARTGIVVPPPDTDPAELPLPAPPEAPVALDARAEGITSVVWCTGFGPDTGWVNVPVLRADGSPIHDRGVTPSPGLYVAGYPWLSTRGSGILYGVAADACRIAQHIAASQTTGKGSEAWTQHAQLCALR